MRGTRVTFDDVVLCYPINNTFVNNSCEIKMSDNTLWNINTMSYIPRLHECYLIQSIVTVGQI